jgi:hypothetical protein
MTPQEHVAFLVAIVNRRLLAPQLQMLCMELGLSRSGRKDDLRARVAAALKASAEGACRVRTHAARARAMRGL